MLIAALALRAGVGWESGLPQELILDVDEVVVQISQELEELLVGARVPDLDRWLGLVLDAELGHELHLCYLFFARIHHKVSENVSMPESDEHRWNGDRGASAVVAHEDVVSYLVSRVDNHSHSTSSVGDVPGLGHKRAPSSVHHHKVACDALSAQLFVVVTRILMPLNQIHDRVLLATMSLVIVVIEQRADLHKLELGSGTYHVLAIWHVAVVCIVGVDSVVRVVKLIS